jgi:hypothetical protein
MTVKIEDIHRWLEDDQDSGTEKQANAEGTGELMEKLASQFEDEQFEKLAEDSWAMGQIMGEAFIHTLEKNALAEVDDRIAGDIVSSTQGEPPMMAQALEDKKTPQNAPSPVLESLVKKLINKQVVEGASASGEDPRADAHRLLQPVEPPSGGNVEGSDSVQKKVASFLAGRHTPSTKLAAKNLLKDLLLGA